MMPTVDVFVEVVDVLAAMFSLDFELCSGGLEVILAIGRGVENWYLEIQRGLRV